MKIKPKNYWTYDTCKEEALKYKYREDLRHNAPGAYNVIYKNKWVSELCSHMIQKYKPINYWTKERCQEEALKYKSRIEFSKKNNSCYSTAIRHKWMDDICGHMVKLGDMYHRCIYVFEFSDNHAYVGLTLNIQSRKKCHTSNYKSPVFNHLKICNNVEFKQLSDYVNIDDAIRLEAEYIQSYVNDGWVMLNKSKGGELGTIARIWTFDKCKEEALKYTNSKEFEFNSPSAYKSASVKKWLREICKHFKPLQKSYGGYNFDKCKEEALKYDSIEEFKYNNPLAYGAAVRYKWLLKIFNHLDSIRKPVGYWTFDRCKEVALLCKTKTEFFKNYPVPYGVSLKNGWLQELSIDFIVKYKPDGYWCNYEHCKEESLKYSKKSDFRAKSSAAYKSSRENKWLADFFN